MSNSSLPSSDSLLYLNQSFVGIYIPFDLYHCHVTRPSSSAYASFYILHVLLLLPLCILILHLGFQQWRQQRSTSTAAMTSHFDSFTYHMAAIELVGILGNVILFCCIYTERVFFFSVGYFLWPFTWFGETYFHVLTCVERYLAVVHPITYLSLKTVKWIRIRNISIGCIWLLCFGGTSLLSLKKNSLYMILVFLIFSLIIILFCNLSVLWVLICPGPSEHGSDRERLNQSKKRAFYTITVIQGILFLRFGWSLVWTLIQASNRTRECVLLVCGNWFNLPCSLVLPLLFLLKKGLPTCV